MKSRSFGKTGAKTAGTYASERCGFRCGTAKCARKRPIRGSSGKPFSRSFFGAADACAGASFSSPVLRPCKRSDPYSPSLKNTNTVGRHYRHCVVKKQCTCLRSTGTTSFKQQTSQTLRQTGMHIYSLPRPQASGTTRVFVVVPADRATRSTLRVTAGSQHRLAVSKTHRLLSVHGTSITLCTRIVPH